jgi:hypothetical protein
MDHIRDYWKDPVKKKARLEKMAHTRFLNKQIEMKRRSQQLSEFDELSRSIVRLKKQKDELEANIKQILPQTKTIFEDACLTDITIHNEFEIIAASVPFKPMCGIYFLIKEKKVVYVGQSVNVPARVASHFHDKQKSFENVAIIECHPDQLDVWETLYIHLLRPEQNGKGNTESGKTTPMSLKEIIRQINTNKKEELDRRHIKIANGFYES